MTRFVLFVICIAMALPVSAQTSTSQPAAPPIDSPDPLLGKLFRSRIDGIQFNPPVGGTMMRELNNGEIVRFVYPDDRQDVRVKPVPLHVPLKLTAPPDAGLLELTANHLTESNPTAVIIRKDVASIHGRDVGRIEATYNAGTTKVFAQQALVRDTDQHYFSVQMTSNESVKEDERARDLFERMLDTVQVLDRADLGREQINRILKVRGLWVLLDRKTITAAIQPLHFMRVVRDGRDVGFIQVNERLAKHSGNDGVEVIIHSRVQMDQTVDAAANPGSTATPPETTGIVVPKSIAPAALTSTTQPTGPKDVYTYSTFFMSFGRDHEDWTTITQTDNQVSRQVIETAYSDKTVHRKFEKNAKPGPGGQPIAVEIPKMSLDVSYSVGKQQQPSVDVDLPPFYLPQALGQLLPRLLPVDPGQYLFAFYVSSQKNVMVRYVDVESTREVELDGQTVRAVPIIDRIGADGLYTTHYVSRQGEWLGSMSEDNRLQVFPTDEHTLRGLWPGFVTSPEPEPDGDDAPATPPEDASDNKVQKPAEGVR